MWIIRLLLILFLGGALWAQPSTTPEPTPVPTAVSPVEENEHPLSSPRKTYVYFMQTMSLATPLRPDLEASARTCLDLSALSGLTRADRGTLLAYKLFQILQQLPVDPTPKLAESNAVSPVQVSEQIWLVKGDDGSWRFSSETLQQVPNLFASLQKPVTANDTPQAIWEQSYLGAPFWKWLALVLWFLLGGVWQRMVNALVRKFVKRTRDRFGLDEKSSEVNARSATGQLCAGLWWWAGVVILQPPIDFAVLLVFLLKFFIFYCAVRSAFRWIDVASLYFAHWGGAAAGSASAREMIVPLIRRSVKLVIALVMVSMLGRSLNLDVTGLLAGFSILGAMVALAGQDTVKNIFGSLTVLIDRSFQVGDRIIVQGVDGVVEDLGFRSTRIRTSEDTLVSLPNSLLLTSVVDNWGRRSGRRFAASFTLDYGCAPEAIEDFCSKFADRVAQLEVSSRGLSCGVAAMTDWGIRVNISLMLETYDPALEARTRHRLILDVLQLTRECGLTLVYPSQRVLVQGDEKRA